MTHFNELFVINKNFSIIFRHFLFEAEEKNSIIKKVEAYSLDEHVLVLFDKSSKLYFYNITKNQAEFFQDDEDFLLRDFCFDGNSIFYVATDRIECGDYLCGNNPFSKNYYKIVKLLEGKFHSKKKFDDAWLDKHLYSIGCWPQSAELYVYSTFMGWSGLKRPTFYSLKRISKNDFETKDTIVEEKTVRPMINFLKDVPGFWFSFDNKVSLYFRDSINLTIESLEKSPIL